jgi:4-oxalocrotonate tautomerase
MLRSGLSAFSQPKENFMPVVRVTWFDGKDARAKKAVAADITESIQRHTGTDPKWVYVIFEDVAASDWAGSGRLFKEEADDVQPS